MDPHGRFFTFEAGVLKRGELSPTPSPSPAGRGESRGFADVWYRGHFAWEYKGKHANLDRAYGQLLQYRESLENPPLLIVSDIDTIKIHPNFTNTVSPASPRTCADPA